MKIHEYQAKALFKRYDVPIPEGEVTHTSDTARAVAERLGGTVVVKAQIHAGGRGKGTFRTNSGDPISRPGEDRPLGGVIVVGDAEAAERVARAMFATSGWA